MADQTAEAQCLVLMTAHEAMAKLKRDYLAGREEDCWKILAAAWSSHTRMMRERLAMNDAQKNQAVKCELAALAPFIASAMIDAYFGAHGNLERAAAQLRERAEAALG